MKPSKTTLIAASIAAALAAGPAWSQGTTTAPGSATSPGTTANPGARTGASAGTAQGKSDVARADRKFVEQAAQNGMAEVAASKAAVEKASSAQVKQFAQRMIDDHTAANNELMKLASTRGIAPPSEPDRSHRNAMEKMQKLSGAEFDRAYMRQQVADHEKTVSLFETQSKNGKDEELKQWATKMLPALREHLQMAKQMGGSQAGARGTSRDAAASGSMPGSGMTSGSSGSNATSSSAMSGSTRGGAGTTTGPAGASGQSGTQGTGSGTGPVGSGAGGATGGASGSR